MIGILCEKPSAKRNFSKALGGDSGSYNGESYVLVNSRGHVYEYVDPDQQVAPDLQAKYKSWKLSELPWNEHDLNWKRAKKSGTAQLLSDLKSVLSKCDEIVVAGDCDPTGEGSLLCWEIISELKLRPRKFSRMYFEDESEKSIRKAFVDRKPITMLTDPDYLKATYRSQFDFMSMQFTRIALACGDGQSVLRQGRLKSAMVLLVGDALAALANYKKVPYYQNRFMDENGVVYTSGDEPRYPNQADVPQIYHNSRVDVHNREEKRTAPPRFLDLATLAARLAPKGFNAATVLSTYQAMYEAQVVSYPRTEDTVVTPEQFNDLLPKIDAIARVVGVDSSLLTHRVPRATHVKTGGAHGANRPGLNVPGSLSDLGKYGPGAAEIYELLARNYLASLAEDYVYEAVKAHVADYPKFVGSVNIPKSAGWKAVFQDDDDEDDACVKSIGTLAKPFVHEGFPPKPPQPTTKWLMDQLKKNDVGTGATRTSTYAEVTNAKTKYPLLVEKRGKITMSEYGEMSYRLLPGTHIGSLELTKEVWADMKDVGAGKKDGLICLAKMQQMVRDDIITMKANGEKMRAAMGKSLKSGGNAAMDQKEKYEGTWNGRQVRFNRTWGGHRFTDEECEALCEGREITVELNGNNGPYKVKGQLSKQEYNGHPYVGFERTGYVSDPTRIPPVFCGHTFTQDEMILLKQGNPVQVNQVKSKAGKVFDAKIKWGKKDDGNYGWIFM